MSEPFNLRVRCAFGNVFFVPVFPLQQGKGKTLLAFQPNMVSTIQIQPSPFNTFCPKKTEATKRTNPVLKKRLHRDFVALKTHHLGEEIT